MKEQKQYSLILIYGSILLLIYVGNLYPTIKKTVQNVQQVTNTLNVEQTKKIDAITKIASELNIEKEIVESVCKAESEGKGFKDNKIVIKFEGHVFYRMLVQNGFSKNQIRKIASEHPTICYPCSTEKYTKGQTNEYKRLEEAKQIHWTSAMESTSFGKFQIMGFNYKASGFNSLDSFVIKLKQSEENQTLAFGKYIENRNLDDNLRKKDFAGFSKRYNGKGYKQHSYDKKIKNNYAKLKSKNNKNLAYK